MLNINDAERRRLISEDLYNELRWMLVAASEWQAIQGLSEKSLEQFPNHIQVITMDSACLHARSLYEFLIDTGKPMRSDTAYAKRDFGVSIKPTTFYDDYIESLHKRLFHLDIYRPAPTGRSGGTVLTDLNAKIRELAQDVLDVWDRFAGAVPTFSAELDSARQDAITDAANAARSMGGRQVYS